MALRNVFDETQFLVHLRYLHFFHLRKKIIRTFQHVGSFANSFWILWNRTSLWIWMFLLTLFAFCKQPFSWLLQKANMEDCQKHNCSLPGEGWLFIQSQAEYLSISLLMHLLESPGKEDGLPAPVDYLSTGDCAVHERAVYIKDVSPLTEPRRSARFAH